MVKKIEDVSEETVVEAKVEQITPVEFADVSILKEKINEIIAFLNK